MVRSIVVGEICRNSLPCPHNGFRRVFVNALGLPQRSSGDAFVSSVRCCKRALLSFPIAVNVSLSYIRPRRGCVTVRFSRYAIALDFGVNLRQSESSRSSSPCWRRMQGIAGRSRPAGVPRNGIARPVPPGNEHSLDQLRDSVLTDSGYRPYPLHPVVWRLPHDPSRHPGFGQWLRPAATSACVFAQARRMAC